MLPIRRILPIVGALFARALPLLAFSPRDTSRLRRLGCDVERMSGAAT